MIDLELDSLGTAHADAADGHAVADDLSSEQWAMIGFGALATAAIGVAIYAAATAEPGEYQGSPSSGSSGYDGPGPGMSYDGSPGIEIVPGMVQTYDGELKPGFGF